MPTLNSSQFKENAAPAHEPEHLTCPSPGCGTPFWNEGSRDSHVEKWHAPHFELPQTLPHR